MRIEIEEEELVPQIMIDDLSLTINNIESLRDDKLEYLQEYQWGDLEYDIKLLRALKTVYRHYTVHGEWDNLLNYEVELDHDLTETAWEAPDDDWYGN
jgi:hypothetical protein